MTNESGRNKKHLTVYCAALTGLLALYALYLRIYFVPFFSGSDANGYHVGARLFYETGRFSRIPVDDYQFVGRMWVVNERGEYYAKYPPLYPMLAGLLMHFGDTAGLYVNPVCALLALVGVFALARLLRLGCGALFAVFLLATNPVFNVYAVRQMSHASSIAFLIWSHVLFFYGRRRCGGWRRDGLLVSAGILSGWAVGIRYTNVCMALPLLLVAVYDMKTRRRSTMMGLLAGFALPAGYLAIYHQHAYGSPLHTGYALTGEQTGFAWRYFRENFRFYLEGVIQSGMGPMILPALAGYGLLWQKERRKALFFGLCIFPLLLLYTAYYWAPETRHIGFLRFLQPVMLAGILLAAMCFERCIALLQHRKHQVWAGVTCVLVQACWGGMRTLSHVEPFWMQSCRDRAIVRSLQSHVPEGAVVFAGTRLLNALDFTGDYQLYPDEVLFQHLLRRLVDRTLKPGPAALQKQRAMLLQERLAGLSGGAFAKHVQTMLKALLEDGRSVFLLFPTRQWDVFRARYLRFLDFQAIAEMPAPSLRYRLLPPVKPETLDRGMQRGRKQGPMVIVEVRKVRDGRLAPQDELAILRQAYRDLTEELAAGDPDMAARLNRYFALRTRIRQLERRLKAHEPSRASGL